MPLSYESVQWFDAHVEAIQDPYVRESLRNMILNLERAHYEIVDFINTLALGGGGYTDEQAQDAVGNILVDSNTIDFTYSDATPSITASVKQQMSITSDASGIRLENDEASPGNDEYYGTNSLGNKGFFPLPVGGGGMTQAQVLARTLGS